MRWKKNKPGCGLSGGLLTPGLHIVSVSLSFSDGSTAADIAGRIYHGLRERNFFADNGAKQPAVAGASNP